VVKFLLDQDVYAVTAKVLSQAGYDALPVAQLGLARANDEDILRVAQEQNRILVTRDRDYGNLVFVKAIRTGVIYLRILPTTLNTVHKELIHIIQTYSEEELARAFVVVDSRGHRLRKLSS